MAYFFTLSKFLKNILLIQFEMGENLVIVESPAKAKTIEKYLGKNFIVKSSFGHIRDLSKKNFGIKIDKGFTPQYEISQDKKKIVAELKKSASEAKMIWLASDEDREGEAIAWHLTEVLKLDPEKTQRIVFHEITKDAILNAIEKPRGIDYNLVNAQQARRILDRLVGFELSPVLWKKIKPSLSAGRVQSVAVRLIVEREREIKDFVSVISYRVTALFLVNNKNNGSVELKAELAKKFKTKEETLSFLEDCKNSGFSIENIEVKPAKKSPAPPFTTSTLQQEASRKFGYSVSQTMIIAQKLYEAGKITYMRTDSVNLSNLAISAISKEIKSEYGDEYLKTRKFNTKSKGAQEAHEAIRPSYFDKKTVSGSTQEKKLYELIWKRTVASQMSEAKIEKTNATIKISNSNEKFIAHGEVLKFDGFLKLYIESTDEENGESNGTMLPPLSIGDILKNIHINANEKFSHHPPRYTEASLVKKLEELGIGRPSTYAPTISTIQNREYVVKETRQGSSRKYTSISFFDGKIEESEKTEIVGLEKSKLFPTDIGSVVNDFLINNFQNILDYNFTARAEKELDEIADGKLVWNQMIERFYKPFHLTIEKTLENSFSNKGERTLGNDPKTGKPISVKIGRYGPLAQLGLADDEEKPRFAGLLKTQSIETISLEEALELFKLPRKLGSFEDEELIVGVGRFGPYIRHKSLFYSLKKDVDDPISIELDRGIQIIMDKREADKKSIIKTFEDNPEIRILAGRYGPYISQNKKNFRIPKTKDPETLSLKDCLEIIEKAPPSKSRKK